MKKMINPKEDEPLLEENLVQVINHVVSLLNGKKLNPDEINPKF